MTRYVLNSPVLTDYGLWRFEGPLASAAARDWARGGFESAIGHATTAALLSELLGRPVPVERRRVQLAPGDEALVFRLLERLPEGAVLEPGALATQRWELGLLRRVE
ncbi:MAG: STIV orfB116 family protein [Methylococcus sp.]